jgi:carbon storage regulator
MLVLSRQRDETIMIGDEIEISVVDIRGDKVRLGITAPTRIAVHRKEVYEAIRRENAQASRLGASDLGSLAQTVRPGPAKREAEGQPATHTPRTATALSATTVPTTISPETSGKNSA